MSMAEFWSPLALLGLTGALVGLPFVPAWREWRRPQDDQALPLSPLVAGLSATATDPQAASPYVLSHAVRLQVPVGTPFVSLKAPAIWLGTPRAERVWDRWTCDASPDAIDALASLPPATRVLPGAQPWGLNGARLEGSRVLPAGCRLQGPLLVLGDLQLGEGCVVNGDIKAHGDITLSPRCRVSGAMVALRSVQLGDGSTVQGPVLAQRHLHVARGVRIGTPPHPSTASADWVSLSAGSVVHGQVLAREAGVVL